MCGAVACFACLDTTAKYLNHHMDTMQVVWARYMSAFALTLFISNLVTRPGFGGIHPAALFALTAASCLALYGIATRALAPTDRNETTLFYSNMVGALMMSPVLPFVWTNPGGWFLIGLMLLMGAFAS